MSPARTDAVVTPNAPTASVAGTLAPDQTAQNRATDLPESSQVREPSSAQSAADDARPSQDTRPNESPTNGDEVLTDDEQRQVEELKERDREVRAHEQAHLAAAGQYARGGIRYTFERGPDGRSYAVGGEVSVDTSKVAGDPEATLRKAQTLRRAALAPAEPSSRDRSVAADMSRMAAEARLEIARQSRESATQDNVASESDDDTTETGLASSPLSCPACGGAHSAAAHDGMMAYAGASGATARSLAAV
ncbi:MAG: putative metalloprotease CJM1_0395 family protein [Pseudomonadota bacterium]